MWKRLLTIYLIFGLSLAILIALALYAFQRFNAYTRFAEAVDRTNEVIKNLDQLKFQLSELENNQRGFLLFQDSSFYVSFAARKDTIKKTFATVHDLIQGNEEQQKKIQTLNFAIKSQMDQLESGLMVGYPPVDYKLGKKYMDGCLLVIDELIQNETQLMNDHILTRQFYEKSAPKNFRLLFLFTLVVFVISFGLLVEQYRHRLNYQRKLEKNIIELNQANSEWEQISHVASHDLQEPLRKIRTFTDLLLSKHINNLDEEGRMLLQRVDNATARAQSLMLDIVHYNMIVFTREKEVGVDLTQSLGNVLSELKGSLLKKQASVQHDGLPVVKGFPSQMTLLFRCLIDNSLKFSNPNEKVRIVISSSVVDQKEMPKFPHRSFSHYHRIEYADNGIGFEDQFVEKMFKMFQRLHPQDSPYEGRGIGLPIVKRIMTNHLGLVTAHGTPGKGSEFILYFPSR